MNDIEKAICKLKKLLENTFEAADVCTLLSIKQAIQALQEKQEREKGCEYCKEDFIMHDVVCNENPLKTKAICNIPLNCCPNCGREL